MASEELTKIQYELAEIKSILLNILEKEPDRKLNKTINLKKVDLRKPRLTKNHKKRVILPK